MAERNTRVRISQIRGIISDKIEHNVLLNAFRIAINGSLVKHNMADGITDEFEDESGVDTVNSLNEDYDGTNDLYSPDVIAETELDYMEYSSDENAQSAYVTSASPGLPSSEYSSDANTKLLLHMNGSDTSTTFTDDGNTGHTVTAVGNAQLDTADKKFGTASGLFDGDGDYLTVPDHADFNFAGNDFTVDFWMQWTESPADDACILSQWEDSSRKWKIYFVNKTRFGISFWNSGESGAEFVDFNGVTDISNDGWHHIAIVRNGNNWYYFLDGVQETGTKTNSTSFYDVSSVLYIGRDADTANARDFEGWIDELRISNTARWTANFASMALQCYSEASIKQQGTYSLKASADDSAINETLTKSGLSIDLTDIDTLKIYCRASRTGSNFKVKIHDSGGTTSEKTIVISSADTWEQTTWDISGVSNANKDDIDEIIIEIINDDSANEIYVDDFKAPGSTSDMTLIAESTTAEAVPDTARIVIFEEDVDSITINTDLKAYISRDGGSTWAEVTLADEGDYETNKRILSGTVDLTQSGIGSGTSMEWKITTHNNKGLKLHGVGCLWSE